MDNKPDCVINFTVGQPIYLHSDFDVTNNVPYNGLIRVRDNVTKKGYWINPDHVTWIGPR